MKRTLLLVSGAATLTPPDLLRGLRAVSLLCVFSLHGRAVSFTVSFSRYSVDLRVRCYDTDAQDLA